MKELLYFILANIVDNPDSIKIEESEDDLGTVLTIDIPEEEKGKIIGKGGMNIKSIRNIVSIIARREGKKVYVKILD